MHKQISVGAVELAIRVETGRIAAYPPVRFLRASAQRLARRNGHDTPSPRDLAERGRRLDPSAYANGATRAIVERVNEVDWYHVVELPGGVATPGYVDHRQTKNRYGLPHDMRGMRVLDVATFDGFWAFEMERRGATVVAMDIPSWSGADIPLRTLEEMTPTDDERTGAGFRLAHELLGSGVERLELSVYDLNPAEVGRFDLVFVSDLMLHLRDPQRALERIFPVLEPGGQLVIAEPYNPDLEGFGKTAVTQYFGFYQYIWAIPSTLTLRTMLEVAGFDPIVEVTRLPLVYRHPFPVRKVVMRAHRR